MSDSRSSHSNIFKTTFLFSFVQVVNIVAKVAVNKVVAVVLGAEGLGIISLYNTAINMLKSGCGLGIRQSAVRDIAEANNKYDLIRVSTIISVTNKVVLFTSLLGLAVTILGAPLLSHYSFGDYGKTIAFVILSIAVALNIYAEGQMAILTGVRHLNDLAKSNIIGSIVGVLVSIPLYYFFGEKGIVPSLIAVALSLFLVTKYYVHKIEIDKLTISFKEAVRKASPMVKMGSVLMLAGFAGLAFDLIVSSYIRYKGGLANVGYFQAGSTIISGYFGVVLTAMTTDYYPRICGLNYDNAAINTELNKQISAGFILILPLAVLFVYLAPVFISFLYSPDFQISVNYTDFAIFGTVITIASNCMGMVFMAKQESKLYLVLVMSALLIQLCFYLPLYNWLGLTGLGVSYIMNGIIGFVLYGAFLKRRYGISLSFRNLILLSIVIASVVVSILARHIPSSVFSIISGVILLASSCAFSSIYLNREMGINVFSIVKRKLCK